MPQEPLRKQQWTKPSLQLNPTVDSAPTRACMKHKSAPIACPAYNSAVYIHL